MREMATPGETVAGDILIHTPDLPIEKVKKILFKYATVGRWTKVIDLCRRYPAAHCAKISGSGDTAINMAVLEGEDSVVEKLVAVMRMSGDQRAFEALWTGNERGNTPLHYAAAMGNVWMCKCFAEVDIGLIGLRNHDGETPMFMAVLHDLACKIVYNFRDLVDKVNQQGFSPLHILAGKPSAFRSGSHIRRFNKIIYLCSLDSARKIKEREQKHILSNRVLDELLDLALCYPYQDDGRQPQRTSGFSQDGTKPYSFKDDGDVTFSASAFIDSPPRSDDDDEPCSRDNGGRKRISRETPILKAARNGVVEMVDSILKRFPMAIHDMNSDKKNIAHLAVENRQPQVYQLLISRRTIKDTIFRKVDCDGNSVLHLAAKLEHYRQWLNQDAALHMQREIKWFQYVRNSVPVDSIVRLNRAGKTPEEIFTETHSELVKVAAEWLTHTSESCSFVAALVATVAFATSTTIPGGVKQDIGTPALEQEPAFYVFATASLVALCFSVTSTVIFLSILTSGFQMKDFRTSLPRKLLMGLAALCVSIIAMMCSFCASHYFILKGKVGYWAFGIYAAMALMPVIMTVFLMSKFPHSGDLMWATFTYLPQPIPLPERSDEVLLDSGLY